MAKRKEKSNDVIVLMVGSRIIKRGWFFGVVNAGCRQTSKVCGPMPASPKYNQEQEKTSECNPLNR
jgi:hypothetical protein